MKAADVLEGVAIGLDSLAARAGTSVDKGIVSGAAIVVRAIAELMTNRSSLECLAFLELIRDSGTLPIAKEELDAQITAAVDKALGVIG